MTRINVVPVDELCNQHLMAEWREMPRVASALRKSLTRKGRPFSLDEIPKEYVLGSGHVKFFFDKFKFLYERHRVITMELINRGYKLSYNSDVLRNIPRQFYNDWKPKGRDKSLNRARIAKRMPKNPRWGSIGFNDV